MNLTRREFVKTTAIGAAGIIALKASLRSAYAFNQTPGGVIPLFGTKLRGVGPGGIPVALPTAGRAPVTGVTRYNIQIKQFQDAGVCPFLGPTTLWGYVPTIGLGDLTSTGSILPRHLGGIIVAQKGTPIQINFKNLLNTDIHILPVDPTQLTVLEKEGYARTAIHLHGGLVPWISDGGPFDWFDMEGRHGLSFLNNQYLNPNAPASSAEYYYPMNQSARFMWYHDHAHGITRLNAYAGLASGCLIRDDYEAGLVQKHGLPGYIEKGGNEIPLIFQDKIFVDKNIKNSDPDWASLVQKDATKPGSLWYAHTYEVTPAGRWDRSQYATGFLPQPSVVAEFFGDTMLVNGTTFPEATVEARRYRLRMLNACNARFLNLQLYVADPNSPNGITLDLNGPPYLADGTANPNANPNYGAVLNDPFLNAAAPDTSGSPTSNWLQIGNEGGFLAKPVQVPSNVPFLITDPAFLAGGPSLDLSQVNKSLIVAPAERPDLIIDFGAKGADGKYLYAGKSIILYSDSPAPFPSGDDRNDYFPKFNSVSPVPYITGVGNPVNASSVDGYGPNTRVLMRFNVVAPTSVDSSLTIDQSLPVPGKDIDAFLVSPDLLASQPATGLPDSDLPAGVLKCGKTLNEYFDMEGRLIQILGNDVEPLGTPYAGPDTYLEYAGATTPTAKGDQVDTAQDGEIQLWEVYNTTGDVHPMHFHLVNVQVINRQVVDITGSYPYPPTGTVIPPEPNELGWKETVPMYPGTVTRILMKFDTTDAQIKKADGTIIPTPVSPREGIVGFEYVWHCHILEHEEHDMMHALVVAPKA